jgi:hypothetical protein
MAYHAEYVCPDTDTIHGGDPLDCADRLVERTKSGEYGLLIHDGGSSYIVIEYCAWCGRHIAPTES